MIVLLMKYKYPLPDIWKWRQYVSRDHASDETHEIGLRTHWVSKVTGTFQQWLCRSWNINAHFLIIGNDVNMLAVIMVKLTKRDTHPLRVESGSNMSVMIVLIMKYNAHFLIIENSGDMSAVIMVLLMKCKYTLPDNQRWQEQLSHDGPAHEMGILRTRWESKVAGTYQPWMCC